MPNYGIPGVSIGRGRARGLGVVAVVLAVTAGVGWNAYNGRDTGEHLRIQLRTEQIGEGIVSGASVRYDGVAVGAITGIEPIGQGRQLVTLELDKAQAAGLTDALTVDYAPENLFGISALTLRHVPGGTPLRDGQQIDLAGKVSDVTMGALLRSLTQTGTEVLTPKLTELVTQLNGDLRAFTPMVEAVITLSRLVADTQQYPSSYLLDKYAGFFNGFGAYTSATFKLAKAIMDIEIFVTDRPRFDASVAMLRKNVLEQFADTLKSVYANFGAFTDPLVPVVEAIAGTLPNPAVSQAEMTELVDRLHRIFADTPDGPTVNVQVALSGVPAVAAPLLGQLGLTGGAR
ncbi:mammalian cell entry protein [Nocardia yamanashiensis]|uniref:MlaD family protein n=1 Tax=Nocardia yamanashiensis TaxID=209247 RepID=UPI001E2A7301|nr:MlaD family protein [Nocardia yamanashiensis]UGT42622.1 mammalian cell entry protein [Nocardia yamanashiensis]